VSPLSRWTGLDRDAVVERLWDWFATHNRAQEAHVRPNDLSAARKLAAEKYATADWLNRMA
jgi:lipoate-protein ligase A